MKFSEKLSALRAEKKISGAELGRLIGVSRKVVSDWLLSKSEPDLETIVKIAMAFNIPAARLLDDPNDGRDAVIKQMEQSLASRGVSDDGYVVLPLLSPVASAGAGNHVDGEQVLDMLKFKEEWISGTLGAKWINLKVIQASGDSMDPTIRSGDYLVVDVSPLDHVGDGIYVLRMDGALLVKRTQRIPGGGIRVKSDNPSYESFTIDQAKATEDVAFVGKVIAHINIRKV